MPQISIPELPAAADSAWLFPGQGAQHVGMGRELHEQSAAARAVFEAADEALGFSLSALCFEGPEDDLTRTVNTQPALVTHAIAALLAAVEAGSVTRQPAFVAGHSLGEYAALIVAGAVSFEDGLRLVRERGRLMQQACDATPGTMAAVLGLEPDAVSALCEQHGAAICNINAPGNITVGGASEAVTAVSDAATEAGASRVVPLEVAGAFHTPLMQDAAAALRPVLAGAAFDDPRLTVVSNVSGRVLSSATELPDELANQVTSPVLWADSVRTMLDGGVTSFVEFGPGRVLTGLVRRSERSAALRNVATAADARGEPSE